MDYLIKKRKEKYKKNPKKKGSKKTTSKSPTKKTSKSPAKRGSKSPSKKSPARSPTKKTSKSPTKSPAKSPTKKAKVPKAKKATPTYHIHDFFNLRKVNDDTLPLGKPGAFSQFTLLVTLFFHITNHCAIVLKFFILKRYLQEAFLTP